MDLKRVNEVLSNLQNISLKVVSSEQPGDYYSEKYQGDSSQRMDVYDLADGSGLFLKVVYETDSYGSNETVVSVAFVKPTEKLVTVYE